MARLQDQTQVNGKIFGPQNLLGASLLTVSDQTLVSVEGLRFSRLPKPDDPRGQDHGSGWRQRHEPFWRLAWVDDCEGLTKDNESLYLPQRSFGQSYTSTLANVVHILHKCG